MKSLFRWFGVALIAGWLGLAGAANAAGIAVLQDNGNGIGGGGGALTSDGVLYSWGTRRGVSTTPVWSGGWPTPVAAVSRNGELAVLSDGTVVDMQQCCTPLAGLSSVQAVFKAQAVSNAAWNPGVFYPDWAIQNNGALQAFVSVWGMSGLQTFVQPVGLSGVAARDVLPRADYPDWAWVIGANGQLYDVQGAFTAGVGFGVSNVVVPISGMTNVVAIDDSFNGNPTDMDYFVVRADGTVWAWGPRIGAGGAFNQWACCAPGLPAGVSGVSAVQVSGIANVVALKSFRENVYALTATGEVWAWGADQYGQLGQGYMITSGSAPLPLKVPGLSNIVSIHSRGSGSVLALAATGEVWAWGNNFDGQLGLGNNISVRTPTQVPGISGVTSLDLSGEYFDSSSNRSVGAYAIAAKTDGSVWTWGDNSIGQLGNGTRIASNVPVRVLGLNGVGSYLTIDQAVLDVLVNGVSVMNNPAWTGFTFPNTNVGVTSAAQTLTFVNTGMVAWTGFSFTASNGDFAQTNNCGATLLPGASCNVNFTFHPTRAGLQTVPMFGGGGSCGNMNECGGSQTLSGTGIGPQAVLSSSLGFGTQKTATTTWKVVTLTNAGNATLTVGTPGVTGAGFGFSLGTCGATLTAGASCTLNVNFAPILVQAYTGSLTFTGSNNPGGAVAMALSGTGAAAANVRGDFSGDGKADVFWRNQTTGENAMWFMNGTTVSSSAYTYSVPVGWSAVGISDFNGDGKADILWSNPTTGQNAMWFMNAQNILTASYIPSVGPGWGVIGTGDFDGNGIAGDILWLNANTRQIAVWLTNAGQVTSAGLLGTIAQGWSLAGVGDFDGNGKSDILWRNTTTGANAMWFMNGAAIASTAAVQTVPATWAIKGVGDFDGDGKADILWRDAGGVYATWFMNGAVFPSSAYLPISPPAAWNPVEFADFNADGKTDIIWRDTTGLTAIWLMNGVTISGSALLGTVPITFTLIGK